MDTKTFLNRVSAPQDELVVSLWKPDASGENKNGIFWNAGSFADVDSAVAAITKWDSEKDTTVYFSVGRMANHKYKKQINLPNGKVVEKEAYRRTQEHATWFKALCFDLDVGDRYKSKKDAHASLIEAIQQLGLPHPLTVSSGRGLHYYWPLEEPIKKADWVTLSIALRLALESQRVQIDTSKINDPSMVLRPVGTHWKKEAPWREVRCLIDCPDYEVTTLEQILKPWIAKTFDGLVVDKKKKESKISQAVLRNCNLNVRRIAQKCKQLGAMLQSRGEFDANGNVVSEPLWRGALGIAAYAQDQEEAMLMLCEGHPEFDYEENIKKMERWTAAPTTCDYFNQHCPGVCDTCTYKGVVSPASLNEEAPSLPPEVAANVEVAAAAEQPEFTLPQGYYIRGGKIYKDEEVEVKDKDAEGKTFTKQVMQSKLVCPYEMHIVGIYADLGFEESTARVAINHGIDGWKIHDVPIPTIMQGGREFVSFLGNKQLFIHSEQLVLSTRTFLVRYLDEVKQRVASGKEFNRFGWHEGVFVCGSEIIGAPNTANTRMKGSARLYVDKIKKHGSRDIWADTTALIDSPHAEHLGVGLLSACVGAFGNVSGLSTMTYSFYAPQSGTGKTLALMLGSSTYMNPDDKYMLHPTDTDNAIYNALGLLGDLSGALDELTIIDDDKRATDMAFRISQGTDKKRLDSNAEQREPVVWNAPVRISTNKSLYDLYDAYMSNSEPARARTLEFIVDTHHFVEQYGKDLANVLKNNYGWAIPELVQQLLNLGGRDVVWHKGKETFERKFKFKFSPPERFWEAACVGCYTIGKVGQSIGLFKFDVDRIIHYMLNRIVELRQRNVIYVKDALDEIGQFLQEMNHQVVVCREEAGSKRQQVQLPVPDNICVRMEIVYDSKTPVLPGSEININISTLKWWLKRNGGSYSQLVADLDRLGVLIDSHRRVTMFKGCHKQNPGQAYCLVLDLCHPRLAVALNNDKPVPVTNPAQAVLQPAV